MVSSSEDSDAGEEMDTRDDSGEATATAAAAAPASKRRVVSDDDDSEDDGNAADAQDNTQDAAQETQGTQDFDMAPDAAAAEAGTVAEADTAPMDTVESEAQPQGEGDDDNDDL